MCVRSRVRAHTRDSRSYASAGFEREKRHGKRISVACEIRAAKNIHRNKLEGDVHHADTTFLAVLLRQTFVFSLLTTVIRTFHAVHFLSLPLFFSFFLPRH